MSTNGKGNTEVEISTVAQNWLISTRSQSRSLYALALIRTDFVDQKLVLPASDADEFVFDVNPKEMDLEEPAAVTIVPTQDGGQFIEHQGSIYKNISLSGTTGLRPGKKQAGFLPVLGGPNPFSTETTVNGLPLGEKSGFERMLMLRNLFRRYFDLKRKPEEASKWIMVWQNGKEGEFYIVEPMSFKTRRSSSSPLTSAYEIQLRTIRRLDAVSLALPEDSRAVRTGLARFNERMVEVARKLGSNLGIATSLADRAVGIPQATLTNVLDIGAKVFNAITEISGVAGRAFAIPRNTVAVFARNALDTMTALQASEASLTAYKQFGIVTGTTEAAHAYKELFRQGSATVVEDSLFSRSVGSVYGEKTKSYRNPQSGAPRTGGSPTDLQNSTVPASTQISLVSGYDTIFSLAQRLLGDQAKWKDLVIINDLKAPYVDPTGDGKDVLRPGDQILFPSTSSTPGNRLVPEDPDSDDEPVVQRLGRDMLLVAPLRTGGVASFDIAVDSSGDIARVEGAANMAQAIEIKFSTEKGTLATHPSYGIAAPIGTKAQIRTLVGFQLDARSSLLADTRIQDVNRLDFAVEGNVLKVDVDIKVTNIDQSLGVSFEARR